MNSRTLVNAVSPALNLLLFPLVLPAALILRFVRTVGLEHLPLCRRALLLVGVLPLRRHYYEPFIGPEDLLHPLDQERDLPGIDWNESGQLEFLSGLTYAKEFAEYITASDSASEFHFNNASFEAGDAEYLYQIIRKKKPANVVEIGSGQSTLIVQAAVRANSRENAGYACDHVCIEPYEAPWLEGLGVKVIRQRMQDVDTIWFNRLGRDDLLFIDSSHIIRPQGDVVTEYLDILPRLQSGVIVHAHDIFSPRDYLAFWVLERVLLWNEQYLLEAFLTCNRDWKVIGALNYLKHRHLGALQTVCPYVTASHEPGSIYIQRN
jgi:hypothetical protein